MVDFRTSWYTHDSHDIPLGPIPSYRHHARAWRFAPEEMEAAADSRESAEKVETKTPDFESSQMVWPWFSHGFSRGLAMV